MKTEIVIFWLRVKRVARYNARRAVELLLSVGATLEKAVRFVAHARTVPL